jgi:hypothetical protein|tara:strand:+ start:4863 stop:5024 length:162 start_codon:yes stop_codon:yes gene_type:complete
MSAKKFTVLSEATRSKYNPVSGRGQNGSMSGTDFETDDVPVFVQDGVVDTMFQ